MKWNSILVGISVVLLCVSCKSEYTKYVEQEQASQVRNDSLLFDLYIGQTKKHFFDHCWKLNKEKIVHQGSGANIKYTFIKPEPYPDRGDVHLYFYGLFDKEDVMQGMRYEFSYAGWAPWNDNLQSDSLAIHITKMFSEIYPGNPWLEINLKNLNRKGFVKIDGNRHITVYPLDGRRVKAELMDLEYKLGEYEK